MREVERLGQRLLQTPALFERPFPRFFRELVGKGKEATLPQQMKRDR
jgi:hypothetical protein